MNVSHKEYGAIGNNRDTSTKSISPVCNPSSGAYDAKRPHSQTEYPSS
jgi:hypothetical protein